MDGRGIGDGGGIFRLACCMMCNFLYDNSDNGEEREEWSMS